MKLSYQWNIILVFFLPFTIAVAAFTVAAVAVDASLLFGSFKPS